MLRIDNLHTGYGKKPVVFDLSLQVEEKEIVSIIGPNGAGKSTVLKAVGGILPPWKGDIIFNGKSIKGNSIAKNIAGGLTYCPQGNRVFDELTVLENLETGAFLLPAATVKDRIEHVLHLFPVLKQRLKQDAGTLSGGEQQMLALARALMPPAKLLLLDEPSLGLAPNLLGSVFKKLVEINKEMEIAMLVVEQKVMEVLRISHRVYGIKLGRTAFCGEPAELEQNKAKLKELFL